MRLTRRQREVAEHVARGMTNREIARALFISERTAEGHIQQILNALGLRSRTQIAAWFVRHQLERASDVASGPPAARTTFLMADLAAAPPPEAVAEPWPRRRFAELFETCVGQSGGLVTQLAERRGVHLAVFPQPEAAAACAAELQEAAATAYWSPTPGSVARAALYPAGIPEDHNSDAAVASCAALLEAGRTGEVLAPSQLATPLDAQSKLRLTGSRHLGDGAAPAVVYELSEAAIELTVPRAALAIRTARNNLPLQLTSFIDREQELLELHRLAADSRLLTLTGTGGVGKTRLALQLAGALLHGFEDGVWLVELSQTVHGRMVPQTVATVLEVHEPAAAPLTDLLARHLAPRRALLVLDNCEHVVDACAELVEALLRGCARLAVLATSREPLGVPGERTWRVPPLAHPGSSLGADMPGPGAPLSSDAYPAMELFADRAGYHLPAFQMTQENSAAIARISSRLEGIPLAIELAAARVSTLDLDELVELLEDRFTLLSGGVRTAPPRHRTLAAAIEWSDQLLNEPERRLFHRLCTFTGSFTFFDADAVCGNGSHSDTLELLSRLVEKSLVVRSGRRYRCLETIRDFGRGKLREEGEREDLQVRHAAHVASVAADRGPGRTGAWLRALGELHAEVGTALDWLIATTPHLAVRLVEDLEQFWLYTGRLTEASQWVDRLVAAVRGDQAARARALASSALVAYNHGHTAHGKAHAEQAAALAERLQDKRTLAKVSRVQGMLAIAIDDAGQARTFCSRSLSVYKEVEDLDGEADSFYSLGLVAALEGDLVEARTMLERSLDIGTRRGRRDEASATLAFLALIELGRGEVEAAWSAIQESALAARHLGDRRAAWTLDVAACLAASMEEPEKALKLAAAAAEMHRDAGVRPPSVWGRFLTASLDYCRESLGDERAEAAWAEGRTLAFEEALALAVTRSPVPT